MYRKNSKIRFDLNLIPLKKQVNVIWLSKVMINKLALERRTGISEVYIEHIVNHQEEILQRWSYSHARRAQQETAEERNDNDAIYHILMEWAKRMLWNGNRTIEPIDIENKASELRRRLLVKNYRINSDFWDEFIAFKLQEIGNFSDREPPLSLNIEEILERCKDYIDRETYKKFVDRLINVSYATADSPSESNTEDDAGSDTDNEDVILIEQPIECIDVDADTANDGECDGNAEIVIEISQTELNYNSKESQHVNEVDKNILKGSMPSLDNLETENTSNKDDDGLGTVQIKSEPQQQSSIQAYADNLPTEEYINSSIDDSATNNDTDLNKYNNDTALNENNNTALHENAVEKCNNVTLAPAIKSEPKLYEEDKSNDEYPAQYNGETYIDIIDEDDDMVLIEMSLKSESDDSPQISASSNDIMDETQKERQIEITSETKSTTQPKTNSIFRAKKPLIGKQKPQSTKSSNSKGNFKLQSKARNSGEDAWEQTHGEEYMNEVRLAVKNNLELELPPHITMARNDSHANDEEPGQEQDEDEKRHDHALLDNLIYEWCKRYLMNRMKPILKPGRIIAKANKLKAKLNLPCYSVSAKLWNDIFDFKARRKFRKNVKLKLSMNMARILRECEFDTPGNTYFKFMNIFKNRMTANSKLRTYIGWRRVETVNHKQTDHSWRSCPVSLKENVKKVRYSYEPITTRARDIKLRTYAAKGKTKTNNKTDNISTMAEHHLRSFHDSSSTSMEYDILQTDLPSLSTLNVVQKENSPESIDLSEKQFQRLSQMCYEFNKIVATEKKSHKDDLQIIDDDNDDELFRPNIEGDFGSVSDARTGVTYKITEVLGQEDKLADISVECREEPSQPDERTWDDDDDTLLFTNADVEMMANRSDDNMYESVSNIKQEILEENDNLFLDNEEEFISCNETMKDVKEEPVENGIENPRDGDTDYYNNHTLATSSLQSLYDTGNEDDDAKIFKALKEGNLDSLDLTEKEKYDDEEDLNDAGILSNQGNESQDSLEDNEFIEVIRIVGDVEDEDGAVAESETNSQLDYKETEDNNKVMVTEDNEDECSQDNVDSFIQELQNLNRLEPKPITTSSKRQTQMKTYDRKYKRICLETEGKATENLRQSEIQTMDNECGDKITEITVEIEDDGDNHSHDEEEPITILEIVSEDEDDDNNILPDTRNAFQNSITSETRTATTCSLNQSQSSSSWHDERNLKTKNRSDERTRRSQSQVLPNPIPMEQPTLTNSSDAVRYLVKLKDFLKKHKDRIGLQLVFNLEMNFIFHDIDS